MRNGDLEKCDVWKSLGVQVIWNVCLPGGGQKNSWDWSQSCLIRGGGTLLNSVSSPKQSAWSSRFLSESCQCLALDRAQRWAELVAQPGKPLLCPALHGIHPAEGEFHGLVAAGSDGWACPDTVVTLLLAVFLSLPCRLAPVFPQPSIALSYLKGAVGANLHSSCF